MKIYSLHLKDFRIRGNKFIKFLHEFASLSPFSYLFLYIKNFSFKRS